MGKDYTKRNRYSFGLGTIGRDMVYTMISMVLTYYLTNVLSLPNDVYVTITVIILVTRIFDAFCDPVMGLIVDNTRTRFGKFKPWIAFGALASGTLTILIFTNLHLTGITYILVFSIIYFAWSITYTSNDISYWSMLPTLSVDQKEREKIGSIARISANIGLFFVVAGYIPITEALSKLFSPSGPKAALDKGYFLFAIIVVLIMLAGQCLTIFGVKEPHIAAEKKESTSLRELLRIIYKNDQLFFISISMALFMIGYITTTSFGIFYFEYVYQNQDMYPIFALVLGVSQIAALAVFPVFSKKFTRKKLFTGAMILIFIGYILFFFAPANMIFIGTAGVSLFVGQAFVQLLMLMFLADSVDYGHWKLGKRNDSITFSLQPFINKIGGAMANGIVGITLVITAIKGATPGTVSSGSLFVMKLAMMVFPFLCILFSYLIYRKKYKIDPKMYQKILSDLRERGELTDSPAPKL